MNAGPGSAVQLTAILALVSLAPAIILTCTCFARFVVVFSFVKTGLGTQGAPPNQVLVGLALFMTLFVMAPVAAEVHTRAHRALLRRPDRREGRPSRRPARPLQRLPAQRTRADDLALFYSVSSAPRPASADEVPLRIAVPAFVLSELRTAFQMGLMVLLPFLVIDLVVATVLSSLGMMMLPPAVVAMPLKLLVFVAVDGWHLIVASLLGGRGGERGDEMAGPSSISGAARCSPWLMVAAPFVLAALAIGLVTSLIQAATQLQENVLSFVPKIIAVGVVSRWPGPGCSTSSPASPAPPSSAPPTSAARRVADARRRRRHRRLPGGLRPRRRLPVRRSPHR